MFQIELLYIPTVESIYSFCTSLGDNLIGAQTCRVLSFSISRCVYDPGRSEVVDRERERRPLSLSFFTSVTFSRLVKSAAAAE